MRYVLLAVAILFASQTGSTQAQTLKYGPAVVQLSGTLTSGKGVEPDDTKIIFPAIKLKAPIRVEGTPGDDADVTEKNISLVQLSLDEKLMAQYERMKSQAAVVTGTLFHQNTGHHHTKVLMLVQKIE